MLIGSAASATDISREIAEVAKEVHISSRSATSGVPLKLPSYDNVWQHSMVKLYITCIFMWFLSTRDADFSVV